MSYPPYCIRCGKKAHWSSDYDASDYGYEMEGVVGVYTCSDENCGAVHEIIDFFIEGKEDQRVVKYSVFEDEETEINEVKEEEMISSCLYCSSKLDEVSILPTTDVYGTEFECDGVTTTLKCSKCNVTYDVVDLYPVEDLYLDNMIDIRDSRTVFIIEDK